MSLRYPADAAGGNDFVSFQHKKYSGRGGGGNAGGQGGIVLYVPPSQAVQNQNSWSGSGDQFAGPIGQLRRKIGEGGMGIINDPNFSFTKIGDYAKKMQEELKGTKMGDLARHKGIQELGSLTNLTASQIMSVTRGEIYNPNVELMYSGPKLRTFNFTFRCAPKSAADAQAIRQIVMEFKKWSAPEASGDKYKLPHVWDVNYGGKCKQYMNKFKTAALTSVDVTYNAGLDQHMTFEDGSPIVTSISLQFLEAELITRKDAGRY